MKTHAFLIRICALAVVLLPMGLSAQQKGTPLKFSLKEAQDYAIVNNTSAKNSDIDLKLAKKKIWETTAIGLPQINAKALTSIYLKYNI